MTSEVTGTISFNNITHAELLEKQAAFKSLLGREPKLTVQPWGNPSVFDVIAIQENSVIVQAGGKLGRGICRPREGVYKWIAMF